MMKISRKLLFASFDIKGYIGFFMNSLQSVFADFLFGLLYLIIFNYLAKGKISLVYLAVGLILIATYFVFGIPLWGEWMERCTNTYKAKLSNKVFQDFFTKTYSLKHHSSEVLAILQNDVENAHLIAGWDLTVLFQAVFSGIASSIIIASISMRLLLILLLAGLIPITINIFCARHIRKIYSELRILTEEKLKRILNYVNNIIIVRIYGLDSIMKSDTLETIKKIFYKKRKLSLLNEGVALMDDFIYTCIFKITLVIYGTQLIAQNKISFGHFLLAYSMLEGLVFFLSYTGVYIKKLQKIHISMLKIEEFIAEGVREPEKTILNEEITGIKFDKVSFRYEESKREILSGLNLNMDFPNDYIITGKNGSGKSTIIKLVFGLLSPESGQIIVESEKNKDNHAGLGMAYVPQEALVFNDSVKNNIILDEKSISEQDIIKAIDAVKLYDWLAKLDEGINSIIFEKGKNISKGQQMRISIARALVKNPQVLFLDEPDANLDKETMRELMKSIKENYKLNIVMISHALNEEEMGIYKWNKIQME